MGSYEDAVQTLEVELGRVEQAFRDLGDDIAWVRAASGRAGHPDPRLPLIG